MASSLEKEAADEGTTVNALANSVLGHHFKWNTKAREFGFISLHKPIFMSMIEELDDETLASIGREVVSTSWREMAEFWFQDSTPDKMLKILGSRASCDPDGRTRVTQEDDTYTIVMRHDFGPKWSVVLNGALRETVKKSFHAEPRISQGESVVTARFKADSRKWPT